MRSPIFALCVALLGLFAAQALAADYCLGFPLKIKDLTCGSSVPCPLTQYCDKTQTCADRKATGSSCEVNEECATLMCVGPEKGKVCVEVSGPGDVCTGNSSIASPDCAPSLLCNITTLTCVRGHFGDGCNAAADCLSGVCTNGACDGPVGTACSMSPNSVCSPSNYCSGTTGTCVARLVPGTTCLSDESCDSGICLGSSRYATTKACVAKNSVAEGDYCGGNRLACQGNICGYKGFCTSKAPVYCSPMVGECPFGEVCLCGGDYLTQGVGKCKKYDCYSKFQDLVTCGEQQCLTFDPSTLIYAKSCLNLKCKTQFDAVLKCNDRLLTFFFFA